MVTLRNKGKIFVLLFLLVNISCYVSGQCESCTVDSEGECAENWVCTGEGECSTGVNPNDPCMCSEEEIEVCKVDPYDPNTLIICDENSDAEYCVCTSSEHNYTSCTCSDGTLGSCDITTTTVSTDSTITTITGPTDSTASDSTIATTTGPTDSTASDSTIATTTGPTDSTIATTTGPTDSTISDSTTTTTNAPSTTEECPQCGFNDVPSTTECDDYIQCYYGYDEENIAYCPYGECFNPSNCACEEIADHLCPDCGFIQKEDPQDPDCFGYMACEGPQQGTSFECPSDTCFDSSTCSCE